MPEIPPPPKKPRWVCCCEYDPPSLRCSACSWPNRNHAACHYPKQVNR